MRRYADLVSSYGEYQELQKRRFLTFESQNERWRIGQERYVREMFSSLDRSSPLLDVACGDGVGLRVFAALGFKNITGVEFNAEKALAARQFGFPVHELDIHDLYLLRDGSFQVVYSSHTLEHAFEPQKAAVEFRRVLAPDGLLYVVLPYPDLDTTNELAHGAKWELGTHIADDGKTVGDFFEQVGFQVTEKRFDAFRESEIWLTLRKR